MTNAKLADNAVGTAEISGGVTMASSAQALFLTEKTIEVHLSRIFRKLGVRSRTELAKHVWDTP